MPVSNLINAQDVDSVFGSIESLYHHTLYPFRSLFSISGLRAFICIYLRSSVHGVQIQETPELYRDVTLPYIESFPPSRIQWVYNILDKTVPHFLPDQF